MADRVETIESVDNAIGAGDAFLAQEQRDAGTPKDAARTVDDDQADRIRAWYLLAINHPIWRTYIPAAREDEGYYIGGDLQWSKDGSFDSLNRLREKKRTHVSVNHIQAVVDVLVGFERQNRYDLKASPQGDEDEESARVLSMLLRFVQDQIELQEYESEAFEDGLIRGAGALFIGIDWQTNEPHGEIRVEKWTPGEDTLWDPYWKRYDLSDARFVLHFRWGYVDDLKALYPDHEARITEQVSILDAMFQPFLANFSTDGGRADAYGSVASPNLDRLREEELFYDWRDRRLLVVEAYYRAWVTVWQVIRRDSGDVTTVDTEAQASELVRLDPEGLTKARRVRRKVRTCLVLPGARTTIYDKPSPFENDDDQYPVVAYIAKKKRDHLYGMVRNMKDPQLLENTRISQVVDILKHWANIRPLVPKGSVEDERGLEQHWSTAPIVYQAKIGPPTWFVPQGLEQVVRGLVEIALQFKLNLREITGINTDLLGLKSDDTSGIAIARRQAQGQIIATVFFDNFKRFRKLVGQRLARRIQQVFTAEQVLRLIDDATGEPVEVLLNPAEARELTGRDWEDWLTDRRANEATMALDRRPFVLRSVAALKYDVLISESPATPSARATALMALLELVGKMPSILPAVVDKIIALADVPDKPEIIRRIRAIMTQAGIPTGEVPALGGPATPPGVTPPPAVPAEGAGLPPAAPPPIPPVAAARTASTVPPGRRGGTSLPMRRTLALASGGVPPGPGQM